MVLKACALPTRTAASGALAEVRGGCADGSDEAEVRKDAAAEACSRCPPQQVSFDPAGWRRLVGRAVRRASLGRMSDAVAELSLALFEARTVDKFVVSRTSGTVKLLINAAGAAGQPLPLASPWCGGLTAESEPWDSSCRG